MSFQSVIENFFTHNLFIISSDISSISIPIPGMRIGYWSFRNSSLSSVSNKRWAPMSEERLQRKAVRMWLQKMGFYEEWEEIPKDAVTGETVNRFSEKDVAN
jgi:hypothetical protein